MIRKHALSIAILGALLLSPVSASVPSAEPAGYLSGTRPYSKTFIWGQPVRNVWRFFFQAPQPAPVNTP